MMASSEPVSIIWTIAHVRDMLAGKMWVFEEDPWITWFAMHGGLDGVYTFLQAQSMPSQQKKLLQIMLRSPGEDRAFYANALGWHPVTLSNQRTKLYTLLAKQLNQWVVEHPKIAQKSEPETPQDWSIPVSTTSFHGRDTETRQVCALLSQPHVRLVTLFGPGGIGKTRLALHVARMIVDNYADGVIFVDLSATRTTEQVLAALLHGLNIRDNGDQPALILAMDYLRKKQALVVFDNFEHVLIAAPLLARLLAHASGINILTTSRTVLQIYGEQIVPVSALAVPPASIGASVQRAMQYSAIELFVERARAAHPLFELTAKNVSDVRALCAFLDGNPLAIELAAARITLFAPRALLARLRTSLSILTAPTRDRPQRQHTILATIAWSVDMLSSAEKQLFQRLSVFVGGCSIGAVEQVCNADQDLGTEALEVLTALVQQSMLQQSQTSDGEPWFRMLDTVHAFSTMQLSASGDAERYQHIHAEYYATLAEDAERMLNTDQSIAWLNHLEREHDNIRAALEWSLTNEKWVIALKICGSLWNFWYTRGYFHEGRQWLNRALASVSFVSEESSIKAIHAAGLLAMAQGDRARAIEYLERARVTYRKLGWQRNYARSLHALGTLADTAADYTQAEALYGEALQIYQEIKDDVNTQKIIHSIGILLLGQQQYSGARSYLLQALTLARSIRFTQGIVLAMIAIGSTHYWENDYAMAMPWYIDAYRANLELNDHDSLILCLDSIGLTALHLNRLDVAAMVLSLTGNIRHTLGLPRELELQVHIQDAIERAKMQEPEWESWWSIGADMDPTGLMTIVHDWMATQV